MWLLSLIASKPYVPPVADEPAVPAGAVPFLQSPFEGDFPLANFMDHGPRDDGVQLTWVLGLANVDGERLDLRALKVSQFRRSSGATAS